MWLLGLIAGAAVMFIVVGRGGAPLPWHRRLIWVLGSVAAAAMAVWTGVRGLWFASLVLIGAAVWLGAAAERPGGARSSPRSDAMSDDEARAVLGIGPEAGEAEIQAAYRRLMLRAHPDRGGSRGLAAQVNAARDRLFKTK